MSAPDPTASAAVAKAAAQSKADYLKRYMEPSNQTTDTKAKKKKRRVTGTDTMKVMPKKIENVRIHDDSYAIPETAAQNPEDEEDEEGNDSFVCALLTRVDQPLVVNLQEMEREKNPLAMLKARKDSEAKWVAVAGSAIDTASASSAQSAQQDLSPQRQRDLSPSLRRTAEAAQEEVQQKEKTLSGATAGLQTGPEFMAELMKKRRADEERFSSKGEDAMGKGAATVYRDKHGRRLEALEELVRQQEGKPKVEEVPMEWGTGVKQKQDAEERRKRLQDEKLAPFARLADDVELNEKQKQELKWGDPMGALLEKKRMKHERKEKKARKRAEKEAREASGEKMDKKEKKQKKDKKPKEPKAYLGAWPMNRFNIPPGPHWDGVDRSNGFENRYFDAKSEKQAKDEMAYKWSVEDM